MRKIIFTILVLVCCRPQQSFAQGTQYFLEDNLNDALKVRVYVVAGVQAKAQVQDSLYHSVDHAREALARFDPNNPKSELGSINQRKTRGNYMLSGELAGAMAPALDVAKMTDGAFDFVRNSEGSFRSVRLKPSSGELTLKEDNLFLDLKNIQAGILADLIVQDLTQAGWKNCLVKIGSVFVSRGSDVNGPWKIPVFTPTNKLATRVLFYKAKQDLGSATFPFYKEQVQVIDPRTKQLASTDLKSATVFAKSGAVSEGVATALYIMGSEGAKSFLNRNKKFRGVLGTGDGEFVHVPAWEISSKPKEFPSEKTATSEAPPEAPRMQKASRIEETPKMQAAPRIKEKPVQERPAKVKKQRPTPAPDEDSLEPETKPHSSATTL